MNKKTKYKQYYCRFCGSIEFMPEKEYGISQQEIKVVYCPICGAKKKKRKMLEVKND